MYWKYYELFQLLQSSLYCITYTSMAKMTTMILYVIVWFMLSLPIHLTMSPYCRVNCTFCCWGTGGRSCSKWDFNKLSSSVGRRAHTYKFYPPKSYFHLWKDCERFISLINLFHSITGPRICMCNVQWWYQSREKNFSLMRSFPPKCNSGHDKDVVSLQFKSKHVKQMISLCKRSQKRDL